MEDGGRRHPMAETTMVDTSRILFIAGGAFVGIDEVIRNRMKPQKKNTRQLGFCLTREAGEKETDYSFNEIIDKIVAEDLRKYGIIPELLGRLPVIAPLHELGTDDLCRILTEPQNALVKQYQAIFRFDNVSLRFSDGALQAVAARAIQNGTGARGLRAIIETVLLDRMYTIKRNVKDYEMVTKIFKVVSNCRSISEIHKKVLQEYVILREGVKKDFNIDVMKKELKNICFDKKFLYLTNELKREVLIRNAIYQIGKDTTQRNCVMDLKRADWHTLTYAKIAEILK